MCSLLVDIRGIQHPLLLAPFLTKLSDLVPSESRNSAKLYQRNDFSNSKTVSPVPVDIKIGYNIKVVIISGPNTGGKTASMKTLGLASVMSKAGMYLPAQDNPQLPWFDLILADIGDHQVVDSFWPFIVLYLFSILFLVSV